MKAIFTPHKSFMNYTNLTSRVAVYIVSRAEFKSWISFVVLSISIVLLDAVFGLTSGTFCLVSTFIVWCEPALGTCYLKFSLTNRILQSKILDNVAACPGT